MFPSRYTTGRRGVRCQVFFYSPRSLFTSVGGRTRPVTRAGRVPRSSAISRDYNGGFDARFPSSNAIPMPHLRYTFAPHLSPPIHPNPPLVSTMKGTSLNEKSPEVEVNVATESDVGSHEKPFIDPVEEAKLLRKVDGFLISILGALYLLAFLDRGNIGNANVAGLSVDLKLEGNQYGTIVSIVYATYVVFEPIWTNLLKIVTPKILLSLSTLVWGILTLATAWARNYNDMIAIRVLLGVAEAGLFPCLNLILAMNYRPEELGRRLSYIFSAAALSGAFGGLLAYGLTQIKGGALRYSWSYLYLVEGLISIAFAPLAYYLVPNTLTTAWFLNEKERELCAVRYEINKENFDPDEKFSWSEVSRGFKDWKTWSHAVNQFCVDTSLYGVTTFMPTIIKGLKITANPVFSQLLTVPVYLVAAVSFLIGARLSDHYKTRSIPLLVYGTIMIVGYIIIAAVTSPGVRFFGVFVTGLGVYSMSALNVAWTNNNNAKHYKRATSTGLMQLVGNSSGAAIGYIYSADSAPGYKKGLWVSVGVTALSMVVTTLHALALGRINARRAEEVKAGAEDQPDLGDNNPHFVFWL